MLASDLDELQHWADAEGSEWGEYCCSLIDVYNRPECISPEFRTHLDNEIYAQLKAFRNNYYLEEHEMQYTRTWVDLVEKEDENTKG